MTASVQEYGRTPVSVLLPSSASDSAVEAETYLWTDPLSRLSSSLWSFDDFLRDSASRWIGDEGEKEYVEVDRRRAMGGFITPTGVKEEKDKITQERGKETELEPFGKAFGKKWWTFEDGWVNLNHGEFLLRSSRFIGSAVRVI